MALLLLLVTKDSGSDFESTHSHYPLKPFLGREVSEREGGLNDFPRLSMVFHDNTCNQALGMIEIFFFLCFEMQILKR